MEALAKGDDMKRFLGHCAEVECYDDDEPSADDASSTEAAVAAGKSDDALETAESSSWSGAGENLDNGSNGANGDRRSKLAAAKAPIKVRDGKITSVTRSDVAREHEIPVPPFWGSRVVDDVPLSEVFAHINQTALIKGQWRVRRGDMSLKDYDTLLNERVLPALRQLQQESIEHKLLVPRAVYGYFPCQSQGDDLIVYKEDRKTEWVRFQFPRQDHGRHLCISDFFASLDEGIIDVLPMQIATVGAQATEYAQKLFAADKYTDYLYFHGLSVESAEGLAEVVHKRIRHELGFGAEDAEDAKKIFQQGYRGTRYSFGYPACPNLEDQEQLMELLNPERIGVTLTEEFQLEPEQSTSAIVVPHPEAKYFNISRLPVGVLAEEQ
jgi:5-methyltetrahydrofolate--homocysteine methyltransferase